MTTLNGTVEGTKAKRVSRGKREVEAYKVPVKVSRKTLSGRRKVALCIGGIGSCVLALSVSHCTSALCSVTGCSWPMGALLAVGIDCGLVGCEVASVVGGKVACRYARSYVLGAVLLSALLNALASGQHAAPGYAVLGYAVGAVVPVLVLVLGCVASRLWTEG